MSPKIQISKKESLEIHVCFPHSYQLRLGAIYVFVSVVASSIRFPHVVQICPWAYQGFENRILGPSEVVLGGALKDVCLHEICVPLKHVDLIT